MNLSNQAGIRLGSFDPDQLFMASGNVSKPVWTSRDLVNASSRTW